MRNRNDAGNVHFDQATSERPVERVIATTLRGMEIRVPILIPMRIDEILCSTDYDQAEVVIRNSYDRHIGQLMLHACHPLKLKEAAIACLKIEVCEFLYNRFIHEQNRRGNDVWATPRTMQEIGPSPEDDEQLLN